MPPGDSPDFIPYDTPSPQSQSDFIPYNASQGNDVVSRGKNLSVVPPSMVPPSLATDSGGHRMGPVGQYLEEAENLTAEGAKQHPIENFVGTTAKRGSELANMLGTMGMLFMGPEGAAAEAPLAATPKETMPPSRLALPERASGATTPAPRMSMREQVGAKPVVEPAPRPSNVTIPKPAEVAVPKPEQPLSSREIGKRIMQGVQEAAGTTPETPIYRPARGTVGAKVVEEPPTTTVSGTPVKTPSRNETLGENLKNRIHGSNPLQKDTELRAQPPSEMRTPAQPKEETVHPMDRQFIHVNGGRLFEEAKPELRDDLINLEGKQILEVLRKSGEDMTHIQKIGNPVSKAPRGGIFTDPNTITRQEAFDILLDRGYTPEQILKEAPERSKPAPVRMLFGPERGTEFSRSSVGAAREVMAQTPSTSRATPTGKASIFEGENGRLPNEIHAGLEKQAGRTLTNEEAQALDRANIERGMAGGQGEDIGAIREAHRAGLEKKGRR